MARYLIFSLSPKKGQALFLARKTPNVQPDGIVNEDCLIVSGEDKDIRSFLEFYSDQIAGEKIFETDKVEQTTTTLPDPKWDVLEPDDNSEPPLPPSFLFV